MAKAKRTINEGDWLLVWAQVRKVWDDGKISVQIPAISDRITLRDDSDSIDSVHKDQEETLPPMRLRDEPD